MKDRFTTNSPIADSILGDEVTKETFELAQEIGLEIPDRPEEDLELDEFSSSLIEAAELPEEDPELAFSIPDFDKELLEAAELPEEVVPEPTEEPVEEEKGFLSRTKDFMSSLIESTPRAIGGGLQQVGESIVKLPVEQAKNISVVAGALEKKILETFDADEETIARSEAEWEEAGKLLDDLNSRISSGIAEGNEEVLSYVKTNAPNLLSEDSGVLDMVSAPLYEAGEYLLAPRTEREQDATEMVSVLLAAGAGGKRAIDYAEELAKSTGSKLPMSSKVNIGVGGSAFGEMVAANPDMEYESLTKTLSGIDIGNIDESLRMAESIVIPQTITKGIPKIFKGVKKAVGLTTEGVEKALDVTTALKNKGIEAIPENIRTRLPVGVQMKLAKPLTREEVIKMARTSPEEFISSTVKEGELTYAANMNRATPEQAKEIMKGGTNPKNIVDDIALKENVSTDIILKELIPDYNPVAVEEKTLMNILGFRENLDGSIVQKGFPTNFWRGFVNSFSGFYDIERVKGRLANIDLGHADLLQKSRTAKAQMIKESVHTQASSIVGGDKDLGYILVRAPKGTQANLYGKSVDVGDHLVRKEGKSIRAIFNDAIESGAKHKDIDDALVARTFMDTVSFRASKRVSKLSDLTNELTELGVDNIDLTKRGSKKQLKTLIDKKNHPKQKELEKIFKSRNKAVKDTKIDAKDITKQKSILKLYENEEWFKTMLKDIKVINDIKLDEAVSSGLISRTDAANIRAANPNYTPLYVTPDELAQDSDAIVQGITNAANPFMLRKSGTVGESVNSLANHVKNTNRVLYASERNREKVELLQSLLELSDENLSLIFRESKEDIAKAIAKIKAGKAPKVLDSGSITKYSKGELPNKDNLVNFYIDGTKLQLTTKGTDSYITNFFKYQTRDANKFIKGMQGLADMKRWFITIADPRFWVRSFMREARSTVFYSKELQEKGITGLINRFNPGQRMGRNGKEVLQDVSRKLISKDTELGRTLRNYTPGLSSSVSDDDLVVQLFKDNYGLGTASYAADLAGKSLKEQEKILLKSVYGNKNKALSTLASPFKFVNNVLHGGAESVELAPRLAEAKAVAARGGSLTEMVTQGKAMGVNFSQRGYSTTADWLFRSTPFLSSHLKGMDRMLRMGVHEPVKFAERVAFSVYPKVFAVKTWNQSFFADEKEWQQFDDAHPTIRDMNEDMIIVALKNHPAYNTLAKYIGKDEENLVSFAQELKTNGGLVPTLRIARAHMVGALGSGLDNVAEAAGEIFDYIREKDVEEWSMTDLGKQLAEQGFTKEAALEFTVDFFSGNIAPSSMGPPVLWDLGNLAMNRDYHGRVIIPKSIERPDGYRWQESKKGTKQWAKDLSRWYAKPDSSGRATGSDISPIVLEYGINALTGSIVSDSISVFHDVLQELSGDKTSKEEMLQHTFLGKMNATEVQLKLDDKGGINVDFKGGNISAYFSMRKVMGDFRSQHNQLKRDAERTKSITDLNRLEAFEQIHQDEIRLQPFMDEVSERLKVIQDRQKNILDSSELNPKEKKKELALADGEYYQLVSLATEHIKSHYQDDSAMRDQILATTKPEAFFGFYEDWAKAKGFRTVFNNRAEAIEEALKAQRAMYEEPLVNMEGLDKLLEESNRNRQETLKDY